MDHPDSGEQSAFDSESSTPEDGASYLRKLRDGTVQDNAPGNSTPVQSNAALGPHFEHERRKSVRYPCSGSAEFRAEGSDVRMWGTLTDVSLHGCYIEMSSTFPVNTRADLVMDVLGIRVRLQAIVRVSYPFLGMGMAFTEIEPGQQLQLDLLIGTLAGTSSAAATSPDQEDLRSTLTAAEPKALVEELRRFFDSNRTLSREEFFELARRCIRS